MALTVDEIKKHILDAIPDASIEIKDLMGDNNHYSAIIKSKIFKGMTKIEQHKKVYKSLNNYKVRCPDGFSWEFNARSKMKGYNFKDIPMTHKKRPFGETKIYTYSNLPRIAYRHLIGMIKIRFFCG